MLRPINGSQENFPEQYLGYPTAFEANRDRQFRKFDRVIQLSGFDEILHTPESRLEYVDDLTIEGFERLLEFTNGVQTNLPKSYRGYAKKTHIVTNEQRKVIDIMPSPEHKQELLGLVLQYAKKADNLEDKAFLLAMGIITVHPFSEGNGRLSRSIYYLLTEGYRPGDPNLQKILSDTSEDVVTPDVNAIRPVIMGNMKIDLETHTYDTTSKQPIPRLQLGVGIDNYNPMGMLPPNLDQTKAEDLATMLHQEDMKEMLPFLHAKYTGSEAATKAIHSPRDNPNAFVFVLDQFWRNMTEDDLSSMHALAFNLKYLYTKKVMEELSLGDKSAPMLYIDNGGDLVQESVATIMKRVIRGDVDLSPDAVQSSLDAKYSRTTRTSATVANPGLNRSQRRRLEKNKRHNPRKK